ncbi:MAG TPA: spermidine synthase [Nocardioidaceae bacterium]|nr:spermidine synthase [Nocardioidaceae bacterium]
MTPPEARRPRFEELDWKQTSIGEVSLRRRREPTLDVDVYEVKLDDEYLMSSLFTVAEVELARLGLAELTGSELAGLAGSELDVVVGGLGLGYTAATVLEDERVRSLAVVETIPEVIDWHRRQLLPDVAGLTSDPRCRLVNGDFFAMVAGDGFGPETPERLHAILLDIDHTPRHVLHRSHSAFYTPEGLRRVERLLHPEGVFALWSDDPPDEEFGAALDEVFASWVAHVVAFDNPLTGGESTNTVYVARKPPAGPAQAAD